MTLEAYIFFMLGMLVEVLLLAENATRGKSAPLEWLHIASGPGWPRLFMLAAGALAVLVVVILNLSGIAQTQVDIASPLPFFTFVTIGLFVLAAGMIWDGLLPQVNEEIVLAVLVTAMLSLLRTDSGFNWAALIFLFIIPGALITILLLRRTPLSMTAKALIYLFYLVFLMVLTVQNADQSLFAGNDLDLVPSFLYGILFIFMILHGLFLIRFGLITSSLIIPRNRIYLPLIIPRRFSDEQVPPARFAIAAGIMLMILLLNYWLGLVPETTAFGLTAVAFSQGLLRASRKGLPGK